MDNTKDLGNRRSGDGIPLGLLNTHIRDNLDDLDRRTTITGIEVATVETTTSTTFVDLATVGPAATVTIGAVGRALVAMNSRLENNGANGLAIISWAVSGATTLAASNNRSVAFPSPAANIQGRLGSTFLQDDLTPGSNTFTMQYRVGSGTGTFSDRRILVTPLGS